MHKHVKVAIYLSLLLLPILLKRFGVQPRSAEVGVVAEPV
jgi:hypothetical protein